MASKQLGVARVAIAAGLAAATLLLCSPREANATFLSIVASGPTLAPGSSEQISIQLTSTETFELNVGSFAFAYDSTRFLLTDASPGDILTSSKNGYGASIGRGMDFGFGNFIAGFVPITPGLVGSLVTYTLMARTDAPLGAGSFDLVSSLTRFSTTFITQLNNGAIALVPLPTDAFDVGIDTTITIVRPTAVPEPSSLALLGFGLFGFAAARCRRAGRE